MMNNTFAVGILRKMRATATDPVSYRMPVGDSLLRISDRVGSRVTLEFTGAISCIACGRRTRKSFSQGYCYPCFKSLAECDMCIMKPEECHYWEGTCRDMDWADSHCMQDHVVYLANSSGIKVGITRINQIPTRWIDQGASQAIAMFRVRNRYHSGLIEAALKGRVSDRTDWRKMLRGIPEVLDMPTLRDSLITESSDTLASIREQHEDFVWEELDDAPVSLNYPVTRYPDTVKSLNADRTSEISGVLHGIKGQYLILDSGVINIRKYAGYEVKVG